MGSDRAFALFCSYNHAGVREICTGDYKSCMSSSKGMTGEKCKRVSNTDGLPPSLKATDPKAHCLWLSHKGSFKNMGCMAQMTCEYSMSKYPQTICAKGSIKDLGEIKKIYLSHENKIRGEELATQKKQDARDREIEAKGSPDELIELILRKKGDTQGSIAKAQGRLEPLCKAGNPSACFELHGLYGLDNFKEKWNRSAEVQCAEFKKSYEYLFRSCLLGYNRACQDVLSKDDIRGGYQSGDLFIREPGQDGVANDEAKGVDCKMPEISSEVYEMKDQCSELSRDIEMCIYTKVSNLPLEKMSYEQLVADGKNARDFKKRQEAIAFYEKACEMKKRSHACLDLAVIVYETDGKKGRSIFREACAETKDKVLESDCDGWTQHFMPDPNSMEAMETGESDSVSDSDSDEAEVPPPRKRGKRIGQ